MTGGCCSELIVNTIFLTKFKTFKVLISFFSAKQMNSHVVMEPAFLLITDVTSSRTVQTNLMKIIAHHMKLTIILNKILQLKIEMEMELL